ncbi:helix-turn-helix domain-containing protein [Acidaminobacter sp. JC074]|uniref:AraC family transcriptional regulator n=1 Tax=Acidaminobacter sp. JC074 TaxID=2530199 RepID=UPI001F0DE490|nr:AraC family transcriptional regulator [Acidaminobacter sp. JC074]MCH4887271.1 helix-turn-helix domain-containing protein [Acidaminobacter sp. JC074]
MGYSKASESLSELDLTLRTDHLLIEVIWFREMEKEGQWVIDEHMHHSFEFHFCAEGDGHVYLEDDDFIVSKGQFYLTPPGKQHAQTQGLTDSYKEYCLNCNITLLDDNQSEGFAIYEVLRKSSMAVPECEEILKLFSKALLEAEDKAIGYQNAIKSLMTLILVEATRRLAKDFTSYESKKKFKHFDARYHEIYRYIRSNLSDHLTVAEISSHIHLSEKQLNRIVKDNTGLTVKQLMSDLRMTVCKDMLKYTNKRISEIAEETGFSSVYYFNQFFKKYESVSPTEFRKMSENL